MQAMTVEKLRELCRFLGLPVTGLKADLIARIEEQKRKDTYHRPPSAAQIRYIRDLELKIGCNASEEVLMDKDLASAWIDAAKEEVKRIQKEKQDLIDKAFGKDKDKNKKK